MNRVDVSVDVHYNVHTMNSKNTLPISEARKRIFEIADEVQKPGKQYTLTENGKPKAVIMSAEEFDSLQETLEILSDPQVEARIKQAQAEYKRGEYITWDEYKKEIGWQPARKKKAKR